MSELDFGKVFEPMPGKVVVEPDENEGKHGSLYVIRFRGGSGLLGTVRSVFRSWTDPDTADEVLPHLEVGDRVIYGPNAGLEVTVGGRTVRVMKESEVLARVHGEAFQQTEVSVL